MITQTNVPQAHLKKEETFALFNLGFRPFFLAAAIFSAVATAIWMAVYVFGLGLQPYGLSPITWHAHEMIYGYSVAVIAGFLLTAVKNWTGRPTLCGVPLFVLFLLWSAARILPLLANSIPLIAIAAADLLFMLYLLYGVAQPIIASKQWKQMGIVVKVVLMLISNVVFYGGVLGILEKGVFWGLYSGLYLVIALVLTMGRRVIPSFIENGVGYPVQLTNRRWLDIASLLLFLLFWVAELYSANSTWVGSLAGLLFVLHAVRMIGWYTPGVWRKPLLWILYLAYGALVAGFGLKAAAVFYGISPYLALHAFAYGGIGTITIGMMARVSLGHTGRNVSDPPAGVFWIFTMLCIGAVVRVLLPLIDPGHYVLWIGISQALWISSFSLFVLIYFPMLVQPRIDGQPG